MNRQMSETLYFIASMNLASDAAAAEGVYSQSLPVTKMSRLLMVPEDAGRARPGLEPIERELLGRQVVSRRPCSVCDR